MGLVLSLCCHGGVAAAALLGLAMRVGPAGGGQSAIEVELIGSDVFDALANTAGSQVDPAVADDAAVMLGIPGPDVPAPLDMPHPAPDQMRSQVALAPPPEVPPIIVPPPGEGTAKPDPQEIAAALSGLGESRGAKPSGDAEPAATGPELRRTEATPSRKKRRVVAPQRAVRQFAAGRLRGATARETAGASGKADAASASRGGGRPSPAVGAGTAAMKTFGSVILAHLVRFKRYPEEARSLGLQGRAFATFTLSADGRLSAVALSRSSGQPILDREALAWIRRASPFPPIPPVTGRLTASFTVPLDFAVR